MTVCFVFVSEVSRRAMHKSSRCGHHKRHIPLRYVVAVFGVMVWVCVCVNMVCVQVMCLHRHAAHSVPVVFQGVWCASFRVPSVDGVGGECGTVSVCVEAAGHVGFIIACQLECVGFASVDGITRGEAG